MATYKGHNEDSSGNILLSIGNGMTATVETGSTASQAYTKGAYIFFNNRFCKATKAISSGATLAIGNNLSETSVGAELTSHLRSSDGKEFYFDVKDGTYGYYPSASKTASEFVPFGGTTGISGYTVFTKTTNDSPTLRVIGWNSEKKIFDGVVDAYIAQTASNYTFGSDFSITYGAAMWTETFLSKCYVNGATKNANSTITCNYTVYMTPNVIIPSNGGYNEEYYLIYSVSISDSPKLKVMKCKQGSVLSDETINPGTKTYSKFTITYGDAKWTITYTAASHANGVSKSSGQVDSWGYTERMVPLAII